MTISTLAVRPTAIFIVPVIRLAVPIFISTIEYALGITISSIYSCCSSSVVTFAKTIESVLVYKMLNSKGIIYCNMQCKHYFPFNRISVFRLPYPSLLYAFRQFPPRYSQTSKLSSLLKSFSSPIPFSSLKRQSFSTPYVVPSPIDALPLPASLNIVQPI